MKDKDPNEDEFNQDEQDNINEADDSFGLPDLDFSTVEEASDQASEEEVAETAPEPEDSTDEVDATPAAEETTEEDPEATADADDQAQEDETQEEDSTEDNDQEESAEDVEVVGKSTYVPPKPESNAPKLVIALLVTLVVSVGIWYFIFYKPQAKDAEKALTELNDKKAAEAKKAADAKRKEQQRLAKEKADADAAATAEQVKEEATFTTISEPTGRYYIVIQSFIDNDMANDLGKKMAAEGVSTALLVPKGKKKFNRLTMAGDYGSYVEAQEEANKLKTEYGDGLWVVKY